MKRHLNAVGGLMKENKRDLNSRRQPDISVPKSGSSVLPFISGMGLGAGIMYALDPDRGNRRRAMAQQKLFRLVNLAGDALDKGVRDLEHRAEGLAYGAVHLVRHEYCPDDVLEQRVRAKLGRIACHPGSIEVRAKDGQVVLTGPVLRGEAAEITRAVRRVRGVGQVECRLQEHDSSENVPGLQGEAVRPGDKPELLQENWAPGTRLIIGGIGLTLMGRAITRPSFFNSLGGVLGFALLGRSGRRTRVAGTLLDSLKPAAGSRAGRRSVQGVRTAGEHRRDVVGKSGVYPATGPLPPRAAEVRMAGSFGQGERGAAGYEDHGSSEMTYSGSTVLGALSGAGANIDVQSLLKTGEIARDQWLNFFNQLNKALDGQRVTIEGREGGNTRVLQRDIELDSIGADVKDGESTITIGVGRKPDDLVVHTIPAKRVAVRDEGDSKLLEIEGSDGATTTVRLRNADLQRTRIVA